MIKVDPQKVIQHLQKKWKSGCPYCQESDFGIEHCLYNLTQAKDPTTLKKDDLNYVPVILISCKNCGNTTLLNLSLTGIEVFSES
ncbi:MAG: hypothetical protein COB02_15285 [Candidatus Cloacimonadota bacterium]|nr:MAG: hypothetical protein COB02_15285 [Candidatus Cloacimonadota bacterium]